MDDIRFLWGRLNNYMQCLFFSILQSFKTSQTDTTMESEYQDDDDFNHDMSDPAARRNIRISGNTTFDQLARDLNTSIDQQEYVLTEDYNTITRRAQNDLKQLLKQRCMLAARSIAPNHYEELFNDMVREEYSKHENEDTNERWMLR